ncbi:hypothetical protein PRIC2_003632 [Phytophthora ramorum]
MAGGSRAVETYLRNFEGERARYQEVLDITLCYGVQCLARNFSLKGMSCNELRTITGYDEAKTRDFYVRNASRPTTREQRAPMEVRTKPSHSWRDGEVEMPDFPEPSAAADNGSSNVKDVTERVHYAHSMGRAVDEESSASTGEEETFNDKQGAISRREGTALSPLSLPKKGRRGRSGSNPRAAVGNTTPIQSGAVRNRGPLHPQPQQRQPRQIPRSLQQVQSKIQPELDARRQKVLRVKKTQSQRMAEALARARLAEYDARRELQDVRDRRLGPKKMPLSEITKGAAALEIVDDFMKSPLMDRFGRDELHESVGVEHPATDPVQQRPAHRDPLKEELYGTAALDSSFLGCKPASKPRRRSEIRPKQTKRNYNGWLGDFGPLHTKTVRPEWDEVEGETADPDPPIGGTKFEWNFEHLSGGCHEPVNHDKPTTRAHFEGDKSYGGIGKGNDAFDDDLSDELGVNSDPVFRWLKDAV